MTDIPAASDREIVLSRVFDAPRELVWKAWTQLEHVSHWWGPQGFTTTTHKHELKPGGVWRYVMHGPDGHDYENIMTFLEVKPPELLTYKLGGEVDCEPVNFQVTVTFEQVGEKQTKLTMRSVFPSKDARDRVVREYGAIEGGKQHLGRLAEHLQTMVSGETNPHAFVITRVYRVPVERLWRAWTERAELMRWFGPKGVSMPHCTLDLRVGGTMHYAMRGAEGPDMWGKWTFRAIEPPHRLEFLVSFADETGNVIRAPFDAGWPLEMLSVVTFAPHAGIGGGTVVRIEWTAHQASAAEQKTFEDGQEGMRQGWTGTLEKLGDYLGA